MYKQVAKNCFRYFGFTSFEQVNQLTLAEYEIMMEALALRMLDKSLHEHRQAFLNFAVKAEKKAGKGKTVKITVKATDGSGKKVVCKVKIQ